ncbi:hypothetical protein V6N13_048796 [Hibiscus sabdariffa]
MVTVLNKYADMSGQRVNYDKSLVFFSSNVAVDIIDQIANILGVRISSNLERYLSLPIMVGRSKNEAFSYLFDRFNNKVNNWGIRFLSMGGERADYGHVLVEE